MQNRGVRTWEEFLEAVRHEDMAQKPGRWFWQHQRLSEIASRWSDAVGREHFTLITVPPAGAPPGVLWDRFAEVAGIPEGLCDIEVRSNPGIDAASALVLRALNERLGRGSTTGSEYERSSRACWPSRAWSSGVAKRSRWGSTSGGYVAAPRRSSTSCRELDIRVVGDIDELEARPVPGVHTKKVSAEQQLEAALDGLAFMVSRRAAGAARPARRERRRRARRERRTRTSCGARRPGAEEPSSRRRPSPARPGRAAADRGDHVLPGRGQDAAALDQVLRRAARHREPLRRRRQLRGRLHRRPALRRAAHPADPGRQVQQHPDGDGRQPRALAAASCTTWCCSATPTSSSSPTRTGTPA